MTPPTPDLLSPLLGRAFPTHGNTLAEQQAILPLQKIVDDDVAALAAAQDAGGQCPTGAVAALKPTAIPASAIPQAWSGLGFLFDESMETHLHIITPDSAVSQIYKIRYECLRDSLVNVPDQSRPAVLYARHILRLAVAEAGRKVDEPMQTLFTPRENCGGELSWGIYQ